MVLNRGPSTYQPNALPLGQTGILNEGLVFYSTFFFNIHQSGVHTVLFGFYMAKNNMNNQL